MARGTKRGSYRAAVQANAKQQMAKASNYGHLRLPKGVNVFKEEPGGRSNLDILPYIVTDARHSDRNEEFEVAIEGSPWYRRPYKVHKNIGVANVSVICPTTFGRKCPICEYRSKLMQPVAEGGSGAKWDDKSVKDLRASDRNLYYVVPKGSSKHEERPYIWDISSFCFQDKLNEELLENEEFCEFMSPDEGLMLKIRFSEEKMGGNSFAKTSRIDFEQRDYVYDDAAIRGLTSLDECLDLKEYREIEKLFFEDDGGDEDDRDLARREDNEEQGEEPRSPSLSKPRPASTMAKPRPASVADSESEPDEAEGEQAEEVEEETPPPRQRPASSQVRQPASTKPKPAAKSVAAEGECPHGHVFGVDVDAYDECSECTLWSECMDAKEAA